MTKAIKQPPFNAQHELDNLLTDTETRFLVAFSGGKDSVAMVLYLLELGVSKSQIELHHHDVDGAGQELFDWGCTLSYCRSFAKAFDLPLYISYREGGIIREVNRTNEGLQDVLYQDEPDGDFIRLKSRKGNTTRHKFPAVSADLCTRWCSSAVKVDVLRRVTTNSPRFKSGKFIVCTGERRQESSKRNKYQEVEAYPSRTKSRNILAWRTILDLKEHEVWSLIKKYRVQAHPCYMLGWSRCSCQLCIFSSPNTWASIYEISPIKVLQISNTEIKINHTLYNGMTIMEKVNKGTSFIKPDNLERWKDEALGTFTSPIIIPDGQEWTLPDGANSNELSGAV